MRMNTMRAAAGQQFFFNFYGTEITPDVRHFVADTRPAGAILFGHNLRSTAHTRDLIRELQAIAAGAGLPPLIISVDEEGGRVSRMPSDLQDVIAPSQMAQGAAGGANSARRSAASTARRLARLGFSLNFAPVADVNSNPDNPVIGSRAYGSHAAFVGECVAAAIEAYNANLMGSCAKHFPGHGDTYVDSHLGLPRVEQTLADLQACEFVPFERAIAAGVPAIMSAHIVYPNIEAGEHPATLSPFFLRDILRHRLGFDGLIFTDALCMHAITKNYGVADATRMAAAAGACILAPSGGLNHQYASYEALVRAAEDGVFDVQAEAERVAMFRARYVLPNLHYLDEPFAAHELADEATTLAEIAHHAVTVLPATQETIPLIGARRAALIDFALAVASPVEEGREPGAVFAAALELWLPGLRCATVSAQNPAADAANALALAHDADSLIIVTRNATRLPEQVALVNRLLALGLPSVVVAARDPYDVMAFPSAPAVVLTYGDAPVSMRAAAAIICGEDSPTGALPVTIPHMYAEGAGWRVIPRATL